MKNENIIALLTKAYAAELETVQNYLANSVWLDGLRAREVSDSTDIRHVVEGALAAERDAIATYLEIIDVCDGVDPVTQDLAVTILADEEGHRTLFEGFLKSLEKDG